MKNQQQLEAVFSRHGFSDYKRIDPKEITVAQWVRMKCMYGCREYGRNASCPPNVPAIDECERFFKEYQHAFVFHLSRAFENPEDRHAWTREKNTELLSVERETFLLGYPKAFLLFLDSCTLCKECAGSRAECKDPKRSRPTPEAMGVDVFTTMRRTGYPIEVLTDYHEEMNRYAILLLE